MKTRVLITSVLIVFISFLNFQYNLFSVVSDERFEHFQVESSQFVLDGYLNHKLNDKDLKFGHFSRPSIDMFEGGEFYKPREWYNDKFIEGEFWEYKSNYGLQLKIFDLFNGNLVLIQSLSSLLLSIVLALIFIQMQTIHSYKFSLIFILVIIISPWITPIARNVYFFIFSYFIPFLITLYFSDKIERSPRKLVIMLLLLYSIFLFKSLLGYDYVSVITLFSMVPLVHYYLKNNLSKLKLMRYLVLISFISIMSFTTAIFMHYSTLDSEENPARWIYLTAQKRLSSSDPYKTAYETCYELFASEDEIFNPDQKRNKDCIDEINESLSKSRLEVLARSFVARHIIPFLGSNQINLSNIQEEDLKAIYYDENLNYFDKGIESLKYWNNNKEDLNSFEIFSELTNFIISPVIFILIFILFFRRFLKMEFNEKLFSLIVISPPLSCFILLKGFSYVTIYTMTYFIWYIPTIPYLIAFLLTDTSILQRDLKEIN
tara:strand:- start:7738 stop:9204 length:1467 start_codon:yes stop_codon:yes gene_type:complete